MKAYRLTALLMLFLVASPVFAAHRRAVGSYVVKPNDTGSEICQKYGLSLSEFARMNPSVDMNSLKAGQRVTVSGKIQPLTGGRNAKALGRTRVIQPEVTVQPDVAQVDTAAADDKTAKADTPDKVAAPPAKPTAAAKKLLAKKAKAKSAGYLSNYYDEPAKRAKTGEPSVTASLLRVVGALAFVVALAVLSLYALKHFTSSKVTRKSPRRSVQVIETTGLGPNRALHIVQAGGKYLLIGSTPNQISLVAELSAAEAEAEGSDKPADFASILHRSSSVDDRADSASKLSETIRDGASFLQKKSSAARSMRAKAESDES